MMKEKPASRVLMRSCLLRIILAGALSSPLIAQAFAGACYKGVNISGAEYGNASGTYGTTYTYPSEKTVRYFAEKGMNIVRLPFRWERLQRSPGNSLDQEELKKLRAAVDQIRSFNMSVILDPHNFGYYGDTRLMSPGLTAIDFADFWIRLAIEFSNEDDVIFGLMNEPYDIPAEDWLIAANQALAGIRAAGANNLVLVPGSNWSGASSWERDFPGGSNSNVMAKVSDPSNNFAYEVHQYMDEDFSGTHETCPNAQKAADALSQFTTWLERQNARGFLGEFGGAGNEACLVGLGKMVQVMDSAPDRWLGWTYWAGGDWWPESEGNNIQPTKKGDRPQLAAIMAGGKPAGAASCATQN